MTRPRPDWPIEETWQRCDPCSVLWVGGQLACWMCGRDGVDTTPPLMPAGFRPMPDQVDEAAGA